MASQEKEGLLLHIEKQATFVRTLKAENPENKVGIKQAVEQLLDLKSRYTALTGEQVPGRPVLKTKETSKANKANNPKNSNKTERVKASKKISKENSNPWPSIDNYLDNLMNEFICFKKTGEWAVTIIQRAWRARSQGKTVNMLTLYKENNHARPNYRVHRDTQSLCNRFLHSPMSCSIKYDGTNVGVSDDGEVYGRRTMIDSSSERYQNVPLGTCRLVDSKAIKSSIAKLIFSNGQQDVTFTVSVYGELMCNPGLYDYAKNDLAGKWVCFGMRLRFDQETSADILTKISSTLRNHGFSFSGEGKSTITITINKALEAFLTEHSIENIAQFQSFPSEAALVEMYADFVANQQGEGLIMYIPHDSSGSGSVSIRKWKNPKEVNPSLRRRFRGIVSELVGSTYSNIFPDELLQMLNNLAKTVKEPENTSNKKPRFPQEVVSALESALTKYDSLPSYFEREEGLQEITANLIKEVEADLASEPEKVVVARLYVDDYINRKFGQWKRQKQHEAVVNSSQ
eukprot:m.19272 g.19272  ORF g.19272 m.19272 type:complete len:515 (-) comp6526_c0_seq1:24-1568(-)